MQNLELLERLCLAAGARELLCEHEPDIILAGAKVGEFLGEKGAMIGLKEASVIIRGVGAGRESVLRAFSGKGIQIRSILDATPIPHNGPRPKKARRV